jgi:DNA-binding NarL/FixJ family response regulator
MAKVLLVSRDLMIHSIVEGAVRAIGAELVVASGGTAVAQTTTHAPRIVLIDLGGNLPELAELVPQLRAAAPEAKLIAFGPHVHAAKLTAARASGCDGVLTRGQFHAGIGELLKSGVRSVESGGK